ncbi:hypothetical protein C0033_14815 [Clostridium sp. chh4-2]|uniref:hypothetical protein n=1 Tax=Clostridium sp. chh4-2 TaxID=2067550 RepID=UPI000CCFB600|nr:hypothetical protein [Clostridium sp. chh4-2]PNV61256.1 hypothetical protein C0033_14815 [Clostridium sp. chh4-2]
MKRVFGIFEAVFDIFYLAAALCLGLVLILTDENGGMRFLAGIMALVLACGDAFHLIPRIAVIFTQAEEGMRTALGRGKQITSITMTVFYLMLWQIGLSFSGGMDEQFWSYLVYFLAAVRILLCLMPQNRWTERYPPTSWGIGRNIPFFLLGLVTAGMFFIRREGMPGMGMMWFAILLSFACYLPVVLFSNKNPKIGMMMLPKTCAYLWMLVMCLAL